MSTFGQDPIPGMRQEPRSMFAPLPAPTSEPVASASASSSLHLQTYPGHVVTALRILNGPWENYLLDVPAAGGEYLIGRNDPPALTVDIDMTDAEIGSPPMVSRRHAILRRDELTLDLVVEDLGSTNGTWVDGERLQPGEASKPITLDSRLRIANIKLGAVGGDFTL